MSFKPTLNWRLVFLVSIGLRFLFALSNSYIHPDEHFQSFEVVAGKILNYSVSQPWEFSSESPARSWGILYLFYAPVMYLIKVTGLQAHLNPIHIWYLVRLQNMVTGWLITDFCLYKMLPTKQERIKAIFFTLTSYVTLALQSHGFSNSIETVLVLVSIYIIDDLRFTLEELKKNSQVLVSNNFIKLLLLGIVISLGVFNRVTFPVFLALPSWFLLKYSWVKKLSLFIIAFGFILTSILLVLVDTIEFGSASFDAILENPLNIENYVLTPLNNFIYNSNMKNLSQHGVHLYFNHFMINIPQIFGPAGLIFLFPGFKNRYWRTTPFLSALGGITILSVVPHQELRFLAPVVPLLCSCFDISAFSSPEANEEPQEKKKKLSPSYGPVILNIWYLFNATLLTLMGILHQGGVIPALDYFHETYYKSNDQRSGVIQIWWRTYSPPSWILGDVNKSTQFISINDDSFEYNIDRSKSNVLFDTMGLEFDKLNELIKDVSQSNSNIFNNLLNGFKSKSQPKIYLITPISSFNMIFEDKEEIPYKFQQVWNYDYHLDLDHFDFDNIESFRPGLAIYELI